MASVNIYKISENNLEKLTEHLENQYVLKNTNILEDRAVDPDTGEIFEGICSMSLYYSSGADQKDLSWNWLLVSFGQETVTIDCSPKSVVLITQRNANYAVTFGHSYFRVDQFSDKEWALDFARRLQFYNVRTTAITNPNSQRNKTVSTYLDYENLDFGSGEALTKLKAQVRLPVDFTLFSDSIEFGNSIRLHCEEPSLRKISEMIKYIENTIATEDIKVRIPFFKIIKDVEQIINLREALKLEVERNLMLIDFSEYQIYATRVVFNDNHEYKLLHKGKGKMCSTLSIETIQIFMEENGFTFKDDLLDIRIVVYADGRSIYRTTIEKMIFYTNDETQSLLSNGLWYVYNEDYVQYLTDSNAEISVEYDPNLNFSSASHQQYLDDIFQRDQTDEQYRGWTEAQIRKKIKDTNYKERFYNESLITQGYANFDRDLIRIGKHKLEVADLYKDNSIYAVKFGNSSGKLCYAVDQSLEAIKACHRKEIALEHPIENVYLWLVLERANALPLANGQPDLNTLEMIIFKNKLDQWKKEIRLLGYQPKIRINYKVI